MARSSRTFDPELTQYRYPRAVEFYECREIAMAHKPRGRDLRSHRTVAEDAIAAALATSGASQASVDSRQWQIRVGGRPPTRISSLGRRDPDLVGDAEDAVEAGHVVERVVALNWNSTSPLSVTQPSVTLTSIESDGTSTSQISIGHRDLLRVRNPRIQLQCRSHVIFHRGVGEHESAPFILGARRP
jgi:hypothetical protein